MVWRRSDSYKTTGYSFGPGPNHGLIKCIMSLFLYKTGPIEVLAALQCTVPL
jgi:hypothetical protein